MNFPSGFLLHESTPNDVPIEVQEGALLPATALLLQVVVAHTVLPAHHRLGQVLHVQLTVMHPLHTHLLPRVIPSLQRPQRLLAGLARLPHAVHVAVEIGEGIGRHQKVAQPTVLLHLGIYVLEEGDKVLLDLFVGVLRERQEREPYFEVGAQ